jgi:hypothetical protein
MVETEREMAINSLINLEKHYQSRYEHYLAMATEAKENRERVGLLLQDLLRDETSLENYPVKSSSINQQHSLWELQPQSQNSGASFELAEAESNLEEEVADVVVNEDELSSMGTRQIKKFLTDLSKAMSVIESVSNSDSGKTLHQNYLHKILNLELEQELSADLVKLYLEEAVARDYIKQDEFDGNCYLTTRDTDTKAMSKQNGTRDVEQLRSPVSESKPQPGIEPIQKFHPLNNLPPSNQLQSTLLETLQQYIVKYNPKSFSIEEVVNYLYPQKQQLDWSPTQKNKIRASISNVLSRKSYLGLYWKRVEKGVYRPIKTKSK